MSNSGNITKALQAIAKFEELVRAGIVELNIPDKSISVKPEFIPKKNNQRLEWYRECFLYFKFKALGDFNEETDSLHLVNSTTKNLIVSLNQDELLRSKLLSEESPSC